MNENEKHQAGMLPDDPAENCVPFWPNSDDRAAPASGAALAVGLLRAQQALRNVPKNGRNKFHGYAYATAEDMIGACRHALHQHELFAERVGCSIVAIGAVWVLRSQMRVSHAPSGESRDGVFDYPICPEKGRPLDKATSASMSTSLSYWLRDLLQVPRCDDEVDFDRSRSQAPRELSRSHGVSRDTDGPLSQLKELERQFSETSKAADLTRIASEVDRLWEELSPAQAEALCVRFDDFKDLKDLKERQISARRAARRKQPRNSRNGRKENV